MKAKAVDMNLEKDKLDIIRWVTTLQDETSIERIKMLKDSTAPTDWWEEITEDEKNAIDKGLADIKAGKVRTHSEVKKIYEKWL